MESFSEKYLRWGLRIGAGLGFIVAGTTFLLWESRQEYYGFYEDRLAFESVLFCLGVGAVVGGFLGGLVGVYLDILADWRRGRRS